MLEGSYNESPEAEKIVIGGECVTPQSGIAYHCGTRPRAASGTVDLQPVSNLIAGLFTSYLEPTSVTTMASGPDPQSLKSWEDAFQYPIPTVRRVEQELRRDIASNKEKLRALVG